MIEVNNYKIAYVELNEIIKRMSKKEQEKIPQSFINNLEKEMDKEYSYIYDDRKSIQEQDLKIETKALLVEIYERYLAPEGEKELWKKYDKICLSKIEEKKQEKYNPEKIFKENVADTEKIEDEKDLEDNINDNLPIAIEGKSIFKRILEKIKKVLRK